MSKRDEPAWLPDGHGLCDEAVEIITASGQCVHLRLTSPDGRSVRGACDHGLGEWWTGVPNEVTCPDCLEVVHA